MVSLRVVALLLPVIALSSSYAHAVPSGELMEVYKKEILPFFKKPATQGWLPVLLHSNTLKNGFEAPKPPGPNEEQIRLHWRSYLPRTPERKGTIVLVTGRTESQLKYAETIYDLTGRGFAIFIYDHRGQGFSERLVPTRKELETMKKKSNFNDPKVQAELKALHDMGHVDDFYDYVVDLWTFTRRVVGPAVPTGEKLFLVAHSLGGAVAANYLGGYLSPFTKAVLTSPMLDINTWIVKEWLATVGADILAKLAPRKFVPVKQKTYNFEMPFQWKAQFNAYTTSEVRFNIMKSQFKANPATAIGAPSGGWAQQAFRGSHDAVKAAAHHVNTPMKLFQAGNDPIIERPGQQEFCDNVPDNGCELVLFEGAQHEILIESDPIRDKAINEIVEFFENP